MPDAAQPPSPALLTALLEAERALGRLAEVVQDPARRRRLWADAPGDFDTEQHFDLATPAERS